jgi:hypothetical protein
MKLSLLFAALILVAASFFGWQGHARLVEARAHHGRLVAEAEAMGLDATGTATGAGGKAAQTKTRREDGGDKAAAVKTFAAKLVAFAKEMEATQKGGAQPDENMQKRIFEILDEMLSLDAAQLKLLVAEIRSAPDLSDEMRSGIFGFAVMMLANDHPAAALALFTESKDMMKGGGTGNHVISSALSRWAQDDPLAALEWIRTNAKEHPDLVTDGAKRGVLAGAAKRDPRLAFTLIDELNLGAGGGWNAAHAIGESATTPEQRKGVLLALREYMKTTGGDEQNEVCRETLTALSQGAMREGYDHAVAWLESVELNLDETRAFAAGLSPWQMKDDTGKWIEWMDEKLPPEDVSLKVTTLMDQWTREDYKAAGVWLNDFKDGPAKDAAVKSYANTVAPYEPASAAEWALTLPEGEEKKKLLITIQKQWKGKDEAAATEFARQHGIAE